MKKPNKPSSSQSNADILRDATRRIQREQEDLKPEAGPTTDGPGAPPEASTSDVARTSIHTGQTTRGSYGTDSSTGAGRYMDRTEGTFGTEPVDPEHEEPEDPKI